MTKHYAAITFPGNYERTAPEVDSALTAYLKGISEYRTLTQDEEREIAKRARGGDIEAKKELIKCNLKLVVNIARKTIHSSRLPMIDLIQEGNLGLMVAVEKFNWQYGYKFSTYAAWWIKQAMFKAISEQTFCMKIPVYIQETLSKFSKIKAQLERKYDCSVKNETVAKEMDIAPEKIEAYLGVYTRSLSLDAPIELSNGKEVCIGDTIMDERADVYGAIDDEFLKNDITYVMSKLKEREQQVIKWRYGIDELQKRTLEEIGKLFGVTKECIRQTEIRAIKKMRSFVDTEGLMVGYLN